MWTAWLTGTEQLCCLMMSTANRFSYCLPTQRSLRGHRRSLRGHHRSLRGLPAEVGLATKIVGPVVAKKIFKNPIWIGFQVSFPRLRDVPLQFVKTHLFYVQLKYGIVLHLIPKAQKQLIALRLPLIKS